MRGGDKFEVTRVFATPKAKAVMKELSPGMRIEEVFPTTDDRVALMADESKFFIFETGPFRVVLCVAYGRTVEDGEFAVVNVQRRRRR